MSEEFENGQASDFEKLLQEEDGFKRIENDKNIQVGALVEGTVIKVTQDDVFLDIGIKTEGIISLNEFDKNSVPKDGDTVKAIVAKRTPESIILSFSKAQSINAWEGLKIAYNNKLQVSAKVVEIINGGLIAQIDKNIKAFVPISHIDTEHVSQEDAQTYLGRTLDFYIIKLSRNAKGTNIILSRKLLKLDIENNRKEEFFQTKQEGDIVEGTVKNYASFGVFVDLGGFDGLVHISDLSWGKNIKPSEIAPKNETLKFQVVKLDTEAKKINLSLKALQGNPWEQVEKKFEEGDIIEGTVVKILTYGAFIRIEEGIEGFVHVSDISWTKRINHPKEVLKLGSPVQCKIMTIDKVHQRISLSVKQVEANPWETIGKTYPKGLKISAKILKILSAGMLVETTEHLRGFISREDIAWNKKQSNNYSTGQTIECMVLGHDIKNHEIRLGIKQLEENPWKNNNLKQGQVVEGTVSNVTDFGIFLRLNDSIEGLIPKSQVYDPAEISSFDEAKKMFHKGTKLQAVIQNVNADNQKLLLSVRALKDVANKKELEKHLVEDDESVHNINLGDILAENKKNTNE